MSNTDLWFRDIATSYGQIIVILGLISLVIYRKWAKFCERIYKAHLVGFELECAELAFPFKKEIFKILEKIVSNDEILRSLGCIRILEIGVKTETVIFQEMFENFEYSYSQGLLLEAQIYQLKVLQTDDTGSIDIRYKELHYMYHRGQEEGVLRLEDCDNIQFYPDGTYYIGVDWNVKLTDHLVDADYSWKFGHIVLERLIIGDGGNLKEIPNGCVDVVVSTRSLCSTKSPRSTFNEIKRVLAPTGRYIFMEHVPETKTYVRWLQILLTRSGVWPSLYGNCHLNFDFMKEIKAAGFKQVTSTLVTLEGPVSQSFHLTLTGQHVLGVAIT